MIETEVFVTSVSCLVRQLLEASTNVVLHERANVPRSGQPLAAQVEDLMLETCVTVPEGLGSMGRGHVSVRRQRHSRSAMDAMTLNVEPGA